MLNMNKFIKLLKYSSISGSIIGSGFGLITTAINIQYNGNDIKVNRYLIPLFLGAGGAIISPIVVTIWPFYISYNLLSSILKSD